MKAELRLSPHTILSGVVVAEIWYDGQMIGTVNGADGPVVRVISKHMMEAHPSASLMAKSLNEIEVQIGGRR